MAKALGLKCVSLNELALSGGLVRSGEVDVKALRSAVLSDAEAPAVLFGHLLPYALSADDVSRVVVLRCDPSELAARLLRRGYAATKVRENVEAELIGLVSADSVGAFGRRRVAELDTTGSAPGAAARAAARLLSGTLRSQPTDWGSRYSSPARLASLWARTASA